MITLNYLIAHVDKKKEDSMNIENEVQMLIENRLLRTEQEIVRFEKCSSSDLERKPS
ncbi:hypothetical protein [Paenibacillus aestuarii]|uniref:Sporulation histidine kinase inhibitor Sda n=1 Tax=Paenibacillus aestuarii TaxID=516965 RepID=A0ABW0KDY2_9BACL|nr:hypothetical protein [Paenibacillus aestuarii]